MKKIIICLLLVLSFSIFAQEVGGISKTDSIKAADDGITALAEDWIGNDISVTLATVDITLTGKLIKVFKDGIYIKTPFNNYIYILKNSIAYVKTGSQSTKPVDEKK